MTFKKQIKNMFLPVHNSFVCILSIKFTFIIITYRSLSDFFAITK